MHFWRNFYCGILSGLAFRKFIQKRYEEAARLFEKICELESEKEPNKKIHSYLGQCYVFLEKYDDAINVLSKTYNSFKGQGKSIREDFERKEYRDFFQAYCFALHKVGQFERYAEVKEELQKLDDL